MCTSPYSSTSPNQNKNNFLAQRNPNNRSPLSIANPQPVSGTETPILEPSSQASPILNDTNLSGTRPELPTHQLPPQLAQTENVPLVEGQNREKNNQPIQNNNPALKRKNDESKQAGLSGGKDASIKEEGEIDNFNFGSQYGGTLKVGDFISASLHHRPDNLNAGGEAYRAELSVGLRNVHPIAGSVLKAFKLDPSASIRINKSENQIAIDIGAKGSGEWTKRLANILVHRKSYKALKNPRIREALKKMAVARSGFGGLRFVFREKNMSIQLVASATMVEGKTDLKNGKVLNKSLKSQALAPGAFASYPVNVITINYNGFKDSLNGFVKDASNFSSKVKDGANYLRNPKHWYEGLGGGLNEWPETGPIQWPR